MAKRILCMALCLVLTVGAVCMPVSAASLNSWTKTDSIAQNMVNAALAQIGKTNADFNSADGMPKDNWCAYFIDWCSRVSGAGSAGLLPNKYSGYGTTGTVAKFTIKKGKGDITCFKTATYNYMTDACGTSHVYSAKISSFTPQVGDLIFFVWDGSTARFASHVGLIYKITSSKIYYVDGNGSATKGDSAFYKRSYVNTHEISRTSSEISAIMRPYYGGTASTPSTGGGVASSASVTECRYRVEVPANYKLQGYETPTSTKKYRSIAAQDSSYYLYCYKKVVTDGKTRYYYVDNNGYGIYFDPTSSMIIKTLHNFTTSGTETDHPHRSYEVCTCGLIEYGNSGYDKNCADCNPDVTLSPSSVTLTAGESTTLTASLSGTWKSSNTAVATVTSGGVVKAVAPGTATITITTSGGKSASCTVTVKAKPATFTDVGTDEYYYEPVEWAVEKGITTGTGGTTFSPDWDCTRGQIVTFLWRAAGKPTPNSSACSFTDIRSDEYYYTAVLWAVENGITTGYTATSFGPSDICTRGQIVTFLWRYFNKPASGGSNPFKDVKSSDYYYTAILWAAQNGVTTGTSATTFSPDDNCTRAQVVTFLYRALN